MADSILVAGAGAVGATTAGGLLAAGLPVVLVDPWYENVEAIRRRGLAVTVDGERREHPADARYPDEVDEPASVILLACKSYDTAATVRALEPCLAPGGVVVSLQNGINEDLIARLVGPERTIGCVVHYNAGMSEPGHAVRYSPSAWRSYTVGALAGARAEPIAALLASAGVTATTDDIFGALWAKLAVNCMINALTASSGLGTAALWASPAGMPVMVVLASEAARVARAQGRDMHPIKLVASGGELPAGLLLDPAARPRAHELMEAEAAARTAATVSGPEMRTSMLQDIGKRRRPEIDYLNGYVAAEGARLGIATPANDAVTALLRAVAAGDERQDPAHVDRIASALAE